MIMLLKYMILLLVFHFIENVPPTPSVTDLNTISNSLKNLMDDFQNWHAIYNSQIEPRIVSTAFTLSNIDSNVKNLQDRAHIWDSIQHHVSAWNEQLSTSDRKLDIISKGQEKLPQLDEKLNVLMNVDVKMDLLIKKLKDLDDRLGETNRKLESQSQFSAGLFGEFAARGILSTLKVIERKLDQTPIYHQEEIRSSSPIDELIHDISAKVDVIFDKTGKCEQTETIEDYLDAEDENKVKSYQTCKNISENLQLFIERMQQPKDCPSQDKFVKHFCSNIIDRLESIITTSTNQINSNIKNQTIEYENYMRKSLNNQSLHDNYVEEDNYIISNKTKCEELNSTDKSGIYIFNNNKTNNYNVRYCKIVGNYHWTVFQRRGNYQQLEDFNQNWEMYKRGFGHLGKDFWFGNENLHQLTLQPSILRIELIDFDGNRVWVEFDTFQVLSEVENYQLLIENYKGNVPDSFSNHNGTLFSTFDRTNDEAPECCACAKSYGGGWWFNNCFDANLNGVYYRQPLNNGYFKGLIWEKWLGDYSLKNTEMMVKQKRITST